jgi:hypothetical protein
VDDVAKPVRVDQGAVDVENEHLVTMSMDVGRDAPEPTYKLRCAVNHAEKLI